MLKLIKLDSNEEEDNDDEENLNNTNYEDNNLKNHSFWCSKKKLYSFLIYFYNVQGTCNAACNTIIYNYVSTSFL